MILNSGFDSVLSDHKSEAFHCIENAVSAIFDSNVKTTPYVMTAASDSRYLSRVCSNCFRFTPFHITQAQFESIHGINENVDIKALAPAVRFYQYIMTEI